MTEGRLYTPPVRRLLLSRGLRALADGYVALLLPVYLVSLGFSPFHIGVVATTTLLGSGVMTWVVGFHAWRFEHRTLLMAAALLMAFTGVGFAAVETLWPLLAIAFVGTINPTSGGVSVFLPLEQAVLTHAAQDSTRTALFARYSLVGSLGAAVGALLAGVPTVLSGQFALPELASLQIMFLLYAVFGIAAAWTYRAVPRGEHGDRPVAPIGLKTSKKMVYKLAALFSLDAFAGGFVVESLLVLWLYAKFDLQPAVAGAIFFWFGLLAAGSFLLAPWVAKRIGLVNTMVFTHLPANVFLMLVPFMPSVYWAVALLLVRSALSSMDVPTRSSYVMAIVPPEERPAAASVTSVPRSFAAALAPVIAGTLLTTSGFGWPLVLAGALKIVYDLSLLYTCRNVRPPEER